MSVRGSEGARRHRLRSRLRSLALRPTGLRTPRTARRGFTLIELMVVLVLAAIGAGIVSLALRDGATTRLEEEGARLAALLESARAESRAAGVPVIWVPRAVDAAAGSGTSEDTGDEAFRFVGLPVSVAMPRHWLEPRVAAQVVGSTGQRGVVLGPDAIVPPQRIVLSLDDRRLEIATDGLAPFAITPAAEAEVAR